MKKVPLHVDFAGGWLDVPAYSCTGGFIVNCAIKPFVSLKNWPYRVGGGLGGSAGCRIIRFRSPTRGCFGKASTLCRDCFGVLTSAYPSIRTDCLRQSDP